MLIIHGTMSEINESDFRGWVVGHMHDGIANTNDLEIKLWHYAENPSYPTKKFSGTEVVIIFEGIIVFHFEKDGVISTEELVGANREYIIIEPEVTKRVVVKDAPASGVAVRWPSGPGVNQVISQT